MRTSETFELKKIFDMKELQLTLGICRGGVPRFLVDTNIQGCSSSFYKIE